MRDRATGELRAATWDEALDLVGDRLRRPAGRVAGPDSVAVFGGGGLTNEKAYQLGKLARVALGTSQIDYNGRWCMSSAASAGNQAFGIDRGLPFPLADLEQTDVLVLVGSNLVETMPPAARHLDRLRERGGRVVVIDPRRTPTAERADLFLQPVPGGDLALALGLLHLLDAAGAVDEEYVAARTVGFDEVRRGVTAWWPERVERVSGVPAAELRALASLLAESDRVTVLTARGAEQHAQGTATVLGWINVALALGMCGRPFAGYGCLTGQGNGQGGREHGQKADQLPGYRMIDDPAARAHVAAVWGVDPDSLPGPGRSAYELLDALGTDGGASRAPRLRQQHRRLGPPNATHVDRAAGLARPARRRRPGDVRDRGYGRRGAAGDPVGRGDRHHDQPRGPGAAPPAGRAAARGRPLRPRGGRRRSPSGSARRCRSPPIAEEIFAELARASAGGRADYAGITYDRIRAGARRVLAVPGAGAPRHAPAVRRLVRARRRPGPVRRRRPRGPAEPTDEDFPLHLTTGRVLAQYQSGAQTRRVRDLPDTGPFVELHPMLADRIGARDGELVVVTTRRGELKAPARVVDDDPPGHGVRAVPLGRRQPADQRRAGPVQPDAGVQGACGGPRMSRRGSGESAPSLSTEQALAHRPPGASRVSGAPAPVLPDETGPHHRWPGRLA